jgi:hypothetical protein
MSSAKCSIFGVGNWLAVAFSDFRFLGLNGEIFGLERFFRFHGLSPEGGTRN